LIFVLYAKQKGECSAGFVASKRYTKHARCAASMKSPFVWIALLASAAIWIADLRRRLRAAEMRGDMYRDISARLDRRVAELTEKQGVDTSA
jgi:hypothetical protein